jgi:allantoinase
MSQTPAARPPFDYSPIARREPISWPGGARIAFYLGVNIEHYHVDAPSTSLFAGTAMLQPDPLNYGWRDYGPRVGVWRLIETLDELGLPASVLLNSDVCTEFPEIVAAGVERDWAWLAHGLHNSTFHTGFESPEDERVALAEMFDTIERATGSRPKGWLGPALTESFHTPELLGELGGSYILDWCNDDQPFPLTTNSRMISVPYSIELNDIPLFVNGGFTGPEYRQMIIDWFEQVYRDSADSGRVMTVAIHPFISNQPSRHRYLAEALEHIVGHEGVWVTTSDQIAAHYLEHDYDAAVAASAKRGS